MEKIKIFNFTKMKSEFRSHKVVTETLFLLLLSIVPKIVLLFYCDDKHLGEFSCRSNTVQRMYARITRIETEVNDEEM